MGRTKKLYSSESDESVLKRAQRIAESVREGMYRPSFESLQDTVDDKDVEILNLKHQIIGYKAVISYLENQLGLSKTQ